MKKYKVHANYTVYGTIEVFADNEDHAEKRAYNRLDTQGEQAIEDTTGREYDTHNAEEINM